MTCRNCGADISKTMPACEYCGTENEKYSPPVNPAPPAVPPAPFPVSAPVMNPQPPQQANHMPPVKKTRTGMVIVSSILCAFAIIYFFMALFYSKEMIAATAFFGIPGIMFIILSKSPRREKRLFTHNGTKQGVSKPLFVFFSLLLTFIVLMVSAVITAP